MNIETSSHDLTYSAIQIRLILLDSQLKKERKFFFYSKAELLKAGIFFSAQFPSLGIFINKEVGNRKN